MSQNRKRGRPLTTDPYKYRHNFRLNEKMNQRFLKMLNKAGAEKNKSEFIVSCLLNRPVKVITIDLTAWEYFSTLCNFYYYMRRFGINYHQAVRAIHTNFDEITAHELLRDLHKDTQKVEALFREVVAKGDRFADIWLPKDSK